MHARRLSTTEYVVLGVVGVGPTHGFAVSKELAADSRLGRVFTVRRPLVYRALDRLTELGLIRPVATEHGEQGPNRTVLEITFDGTRRLEGWLEEPVGHVRDLRIEFLAKVALLEALGISPAPLVRAQRAALDPTLAALDGATQTDHVELWRYHNAVAADAYLRQLESRYA